MIKTETIPVYGMMCEHCVKAVTLALTGLEGVQKVEVALAENSATVTFDDALTGPDRFRDAVIEEGYSPVPVEPSEPPLAEPVEAAPALPDTITSTFTVQGMHCVNCAAAIEKGFRNFAGVGRAVVNFPLERLTIEHAPSVSEQDIIAKVRDLGYGASPGISFKEDASLAPKEKFRFLFALCCTVPLVAFMYFMPFGHLATQYVMFALASLVQAVSGRTFYEGAWHSL